MEKIDMFDENGVKDKQRLLDKMNSIVKEESCNCKEKNKKLFAQNNGNEVVKEQEQQKQLEVANHVEALIENRENKVQACERVNVLDSDPPDKQTLLEKFKKVALKDKIQSAGAENIFSQDFYISENMLHSIKETQQDGVMTVFGKEIEALLVIKNDNSPYCFIGLTSEDIEEVVPKLSQIQPKSDVCLISIKGTSMHGTLPDGAENNLGFLSLLEQAQFFNGNLQALAAQKEKLHWISDNYQKKLEFFKDNLLSLRLCDEKEINDLRDRLDKDCSNANPNPSTNSPAITHMYSADTKGAKSHISNDADQTRDPAQKALNASDDIGKKENSRNLPE